MIDDNSFDDVIDFWFRELDKKSWWAKSEKLDDMIRNRFFHTHNKAIQCELYTWRSEPTGRLAEIIVLDQFSRNIFRNLPDAFNFDSLALGLAQEAVANKTQTNLDNDQKAFLYMPFMHSESKLIHEIAVELYSESGLESNLEFELKHKAIIDRFGRYPHRNQILGRKSTKEELEFLKQSGSSF